MVAASSVAMLATGSPSFARELSLAAGWYGVVALALVWALMELTQWLWRGKPPSRLARAASLLGILTLGQGLAVAGTHMAVALLADAWPSLSVSLAALLGFMAMVTGALVLGPALLRRLVRTAHPDDPG
jgi:hypothetical protein